MPFAWVGCCNLEAFDTKYHPVITALCAGGKRFKKLKNYVEPTFRVKINYADRLIFRTKIINKEPYIELISIVKKHDYKRPEPVAQLSSAMLNEENAIICMPEDEAFESEPLGARLYCRNELIQLNDTQKSITLEQTPLVLSGGGGSGKPGPSTK